MKPIVQNTAVANLHPATPLTSPYPNPTKRERELEYQRTFGSPPQPSKLPVNNPPPLSESHGLEAEDQHDSRVIHWKQKFNAGQRFEINGETFELAHVGKRSLVLRHVNNI